ncbi:hypothetical protein M2T54_29260, partial [Klebsiella pneumoniae]|nr:hypothetical protein [Klebsiella pneumoniae]
EIDQMDVLDILNDDGSLKPIREWPKIWRTTLSGFDLSSTSDITSVSYAFPFEREIRLLTRHYLPEAQLLNVANKNRAIYRQWVKAGWIRTTPGDCIDYDRIRDDILR